MAEHTCRFKIGGGGGVGIINTLMKQEWSEMCGVAYTPFSVIEETKIHGGPAAGEAHPQIGVLYG